MNILLKIGWETGCETQSKENVEKLICVSYKRVRKLCLESIEHSATCCRQLLKKYSLLGSFICSLVTCIENQIDLRQRNLGYSLKNIPIASIPLRFE